MTYLGFVTVMCLAYQPNAAAPISSTNQAVKSEKIYLPTADGAVDCSIPRALETDEVAEYVEHFRKAARNCIEAGTCHIDTKFMYIYPWFLRALELYPILLNLCALFTYQTGVMLVCNSESLTV